MGYYRSRTRALVTCPSLGHGGHPEPSAAHPGVSSAAAHAHLAHPFIPSTFLTVVFTKGKL